MNRQVLIVDDEASVRDLLSLYLRKKGLDVMTACNMNGAMELLNQSPFQLAILDAILDGESGLDLLRLVRSKCPQMPVIIFSGSHDEDLQQKAIAAGANGFLHKADSLDNLFAEVRRQIAA